MRKDEFAPLPARPLAFLQKLEWPVFVLLFLIVGVLGHDPWKQDETYTFGIIYHFYTTHNWLIPVNAGVPFMEKPPLYYWTATLLCKLLTGVMPLQNAARLASTFFMLISCGAIWGTSQILFQHYTERRAMGCTTLALFLGCFGVARHAHDMFTDVALLAGTSVALLGIAMLVVREHQWARAAIAIGAGTGMAFLSKGLALPAILCMSGMMMIIALPQLRTRRVALSLLVAICVASPFVIIWPYLLYQQSPTLFMEWFWDNNIGRFLGFSVDRLGAPNTHCYIGAAILWFALPLFPLACAAVAMKFRQWRAPEIIIPLVFCLTGFVFLLFSASARALYLLPFMPGLALLATQSLMRIPSRWLTAWNWAVRLAASIAAVILVCIWISLLHPDRAQPFASLYGDWFSLGFIPKSQKFSCIIACVFTMVWVASFRLDTHSYTGTACLWFVAVAFLWGLGNCLLLPWVNETRSFRPVIEEINTVINTSPDKDTCIARFNLGESVSPMWQYFGKGKGMGPLEDFSGKSCPLLLTLNGKKMPEPSNPHWHLVWKGARSLDSKDELLLYERDNKSS